MDLAICARRFPKRCQRIHVANPQLKPTWIILLLLMNALWAAAYSCFKLLAPVMDAGTLATLRFGFSGILMAFVWRWLPGRGPKGGDLVRAVVMGAVVFVAAPRLQVAGVQLGKAGDAAILMAFDPVIAAVAAALFLRERIRPRSWIGFGLGIAGVATLAEVWRPDFRLPSLSANLLILASFVCESAYSVMGKKLIHHSHPLKVLAVALLSSTAMNLMLSSESAGRAILDCATLDWLAMAYLVVICTVVGYALWFFAIRQIPINVVATTVFMQPIAGVIFALLLIGERPRWSQLGGTVFICMGMLISLRNTRDNFRLAPETLSPKSTD